MTRRITDLNDPAFMDLFTNVQRGWFRLETLQHYSTGEDDLVRLVTSGRPLPIEDGPWYDMLRAHTAAGRKLRRVHVIEEPHSPYITYELAAYRDTTAAGEDVRIVPTPAGSWPAGLPQHDFWIFDEQQVWVQRYDEHGAFESVEQLTDTAAIKQHRQWAEAAWRAAVPWTQYVAGGLPRAI